MGLFARAEPGGPARAASPATGPDSAGGEAWWLPALTPAEQETRATIPEWAAFVEQALGHATAAGHGPGERIRSAPGMGPEGRLAHPLWPFLVAADVRFHAPRPTAPPGTCPTGPAARNAQGTPPAASGTATPSTPSNPTSAPRPAGPPSAEPGLLYSGAAGQPDTEARERREALLARLRDEGPQQERRAVWAGARRHLAAGLVALAGRTLVAELRAARLGGRLHGEDGAQRFDSFLRAVAARPALARLLCRRHPVLARLLAERCLNTVAAATELLDRYRADREDILTAGLLQEPEARGSDPGPLTEVRFGLGDPHSGGRTVVMLEFADGRRLVYKPRPLGLHARWNDLLGWFAGHHPELASRPVQVLPREGYGWAGHVAEGSCRSLASVAAFYERLGAQLALLHAVDAVDIHAENLVAAADQPVVVDVETLFHPWWVPGTDGGEDPAVTAVAASLHRTAALPNPLLGALGGLDTSALAAGPVAEPPVPLPVWLETATDRMHLAYRPRPWAGAANRPTLATPSASPTGVQIDPARHVGSVLRGFRAAYRTISAHAAELTADGGLVSRFADETTRLVMRPSQTYAEMLLEATEPDLLRTMAARESAFRELWEETGHPHLRTLAPYERAELVAGDIPVFATSPGSRGVRTAAGREIGTLLAEPGLDAAVAKIRAMGPADLDRQEWLIRACLATKADSPQHHAPAPPQPAPGSGHAAAGAADLADIEDVDWPATAGRLVELATGIGDDLVARACRGAGRANWVGLQSVEADESRWSVLPMGMALADGYTGVALYLAELARATGTARYAEVAAEAVTALPRMLRLLAEHPELAAAVGPGGLYGLGGVAYATARLTELLDDSDELTAALPDAVIALAAAAADPSARDGLADGLAGALLAARAVHAQCGLPEAGRLAEDLAARLAEEKERWPRTPGLLWGRDGIAPALREEPAPGGPGEVRDLGWCTGLAGVAAVRGGEYLARHLALVDAPERRTLSDLSLCHGELGVLEPLVAAACAEPDGSGGPAPRAVLERSAARLVRSAERDGPRCGTPLGVTTPGLTAGLAGIGHGMLRLALGPQIPSVLLLQTGGGSEARLTTTERAPLRWTTTP